MADSTPHSGDGSVGPLSNHDLRDLGPISENTILREQSASPTSFSSQPECVDFPAGGNVPRRRSTDPAVSPGSSADHTISSAPRANTIHAEHASASKNSDGHNSRAFPPSSFLKFQAAQASPPGAQFRRHSTIDTKNSEPFQDTEIWDQKALLSFDGGGIRGYSALLIMQELMRAIGRIERAEVLDPAVTSYHPLHPTPSMATDTESIGSGPSVNVRATDTSAWLPCHYFDYIAGTSTGGLIGIMLGRLRMNIDDCISDYETLGARVFARSRWFHLRSPLWFPREKYNHRILTDVIQGVVRDRVPKVKTFPGGQTFAFDENRCRVIVVAYRQPRGHEADTLPYLFRTYKNLRRGETKEERLLDRNPGLAHDIPIWEAGRATSAAPTYFKEVRIDGRLYLDGGFGANNPCVELYQEVRKMNNNNPKSVGLVVTVGTGKSKASRFSDTNTAKRFDSGIQKFMRYENFARKWAASSEVADLNMRQIRKDCQNSFGYHRFNVKEGLSSMKLDEWKTRGRIRVWFGQRIGKLRGHQDCSSEDNPTADGEKIDVSSPNGAVDAQTCQRTKADSEPLHRHSNIPLWLQERNRTLEDIRKHTLNYLECPKVKKEIEECAQALVQVRRARARANPQRWERVCFNTWYQCSITGCPRGEKEYPDRHALSKHLLDKHHNQFTRGEEDKERLETALDMCKVMVH